MSKKEKKEKKGNEFPAKFFYEHGKHIADQIAKTSACGAREYLAKLERRIAIERAIWNDNNGISNTVEI